MNKDLRKIVKALEGQGFEVRVTRRGHVVVTRDGELVATFSGTASDWRSMQNGISHAKRAGFVWPPKR